MPIRKENLHRYPANWPEISARIKQRAKNKCEQCGLANGRLGKRDGNGRWHDALPTGTDGMRLTWPRPGEHAWCADGVFGKIVRIVLTVAHLNHEPEDVRAENLRAWCQACHNRYDAATRRAGMKARSRSAAAIRDLF